MPSWYKQILFGMALVMFCSGGDGGGGGGSGDFASGLVCGANGHDHAEDAV